MSHTNASLLSPMNTDNLSEILSRNSETCELNASRLENLTFHSVKLGLAEHFNLLVPTSDYLNEKPKLVSIIKTAATWASSRGYIDVIRAILSKGISFTQNELIKIFAMSAQRGKCIITLRFIEDLYKDTYHKSIHLDSRKYVSSLTKRAAKLGNVNILTYLLNHHTDILLNDSIIKECSFKRKFEPTIELINKGFSYRSIVVSKILAKSHPESRFNTLIQAIKKQDGQHERIIAEIISLAVSQKRESFVLQMIKNEESIRGYEEAILTYYLKIKKISLLDYIAIAPVCYKSACLSLLT
jgi:hypothetical protein